MSAREKRIRAFSELGEAMRHGAEGSDKGIASLFSDLIYKSHNPNPWFTQENIKLALESIGMVLNEESINHWLSHYKIPEDTKPYDIAIIMAGNIPLVGFHDLLSVLITGHRAVVKLSSKDEVLMKAVIMALIKIEPQFSNMIRITSGPLDRFDGVIATGSDNTSRYFEYYFRRYPSIIRHNRNSIAFIEGNESIDELTMLAGDVFSYFGLGCRNVSKIYIPDGYDLNHMVSHWGAYEKLRSHHKYAANYDHNKAVMIVNREPFTDTGFVLLKEDNSLTPPMAVLNYEYYDSSDAIKTSFLNITERIQCITGHGYAPLGSSQSPSLWDYADNVDTIDFLLKNFSSY